MTAAPLEKEEKRSNQGLCDPRSHKMKNAFPLWDD